MRIPILFLLVATALVAAESPRLDAKKFDPAVVKYLESKHPLFNSMPPAAEAKLRDTNDLLRLQNELTVLEESRKPVADFLKKQNLEPADADDALWLAYKLTRSEPGVGWGSEKPTTLTKELVVSSLLEGSGKLEIKTDPHGCTVFVDGERLTRKSNFGRLVPAGERTVRVELDGYRPAEQTVKVPVGGSGTFEAKLQKR